MAVHGPATARRPGSGAGRLTLGLVTANIHLGVGATLWSGAVAAAERNDVNLVALPGGPLRPGGAPRNELYELISPERLDGVICWTSTLSLPAAPDRAERLIRQLDALPVISLNHPLGDHETLRLDSAAGMREAVGHLVEVHGRCRLACIRGPLANSVSLDRYRAYTDALARHRIPPDRSLVTASVDFGGGAGAAAVRVLLDVRGLRPGRDFDALVACSDVLAADAVRFLGVRGVRVPEEVAVISFNDSLEAMLSDPPLTSVALPFAELGELAVDTLIARLRGTPPPARRAVTGTLVTRRSCGCHSPLVAQGAAGVPAADIPAADGVAAGRPARGGAGRAGAHGTSDIVAAPPFEEGFADLPRAGRELAAAFRTDLVPHLTAEGTPAAHPPAATGPTGAHDRSRPSGSAFLDLLERLIGSRVRTQEDTAAWDRALLRVREWAVPGLPPQARWRAERLLGQARLMVADKSQRLLEYERWAEQQESRRLRELGTTLTTAVDVGALSEALARLLPGTGVPGCRLVLYEESAHPGGGGGRGTARLVRASAEGERCDRPGGSGDPDHRHVPDGRHASDRWGKHRPDDRPDRPGSPDRPGAGNGPSPGTPSPGSPYGAPYAPFCGPPYPAARLLPEELLPPDRRFTLIAEPLHIGAEQLGFALFEAGAQPGAAHRGALYRALGDQISAALKGIRLFDEVRRARDTAEQASRLKTRLLDNATDELRTPVEAILRHTRPDPGAARVAPEAALRLAHEDAGRLLRLIDDLLDLSRSEIDALDLSRTLLDPRPLLIDAFRTVAASRPGGADWQLRLPRRLPAVQADGARLRQILLNLLAAAAPGLTVPGLTVPGLTAPGPAAERGRVLLTAEVCPPVLGIHIACPAVRPAAGIPADEYEHLFQPFAAGAPGMRLGLAIARRLAVLHGGSVTPEHGHGPGGFRLTLPLPTPAETPAPAATATATAAATTTAIATAAPAATPVTAPAAAAGPAPGSPPAEAGTAATAPCRTLLIAATGDPPPEISAVARQQRLTPRRLHPDDDIASLVAEGRAAPAAIACDAGELPPQEWSALQRLHDHPVLRHTPFLLYGLPARALGHGLTGALHALRPPGLADPVVIADDCAPAREELRKLLTTVLPGRAVRTAADGTAALALLAEDVPCLLIVSRVLPDMDGFDIVERMSDGTGQSGTPVLMLSDRGFTFGDVRRAEPHPALVLLDRDILTGTETTALLTAMLDRTDPGAPRSCTPVRHALAYLEQHYRHRISRWQVARAAGVSEDHLSRLFHRQFGLALWEYLTRLRIQRAKERLRHSDDSVQAVARAVGFHDRAYFSRVFRKQTGVAPHAYRDAS